MASWHLSMSNDGDASSGPVLVVNYSDWRSDILILLRSVPPSLILNPHYVYKRASALKDTLFY